MENAIAVLNRPSGDLASDNNSEQKAYILRLDFRLKDSLKQGVVGIGWSRAKNFDKHPDRSAIKEELKGTYSELYLHNERALGNVTSSIQQFIAMKKGDMIVVPVPGAFHLASVDSDIYNEQDGRNSDFVWRRKVKWLTQADKPIHRNFADNHLQRRLKIRQTCVDATDILQSINEAKTRTSPVDFSEEIIKASHDAIKSVLLNKINDYGLEDLVRRLAIADGAARATILPRSSKANGDADVEAIYDIGIGNYLKPVKVLYQVKQHNDKTDEYGVRQLIDRMEHDGDDVFAGCLVTTADTVSDGASHLAENRDITIMTVKDLIEWVLKTGLSLLGDTNQT